MQLAIMSEEGVLDNRDYDLEYMEWVKDLDNDKQEQKRQEEV